MKQHLNTGHRIQCVCVCVCDWLRCMDYTVYFTNTYTEKVSLQIELQQSLSQLLYLSERSVYNSSIKSPAICLSFNFTTE